MHWSKVVQFLESKCQKYIPSEGKEPNNSKCRGFVMPSGLQLAVDTTSEAQHANVWIEDCGELPPGISKFYDEAKTRTSALASVAPRLTGPGYGKPSRPAYMCSIENIQNLESLFTWYSKLSASTQSKHKIKGMTTMSSEYSNQSMSPLNQILYGPPGTGKTYKTAQLAVDICDGPAIRTREAILARYNQLQIEERICFVTFHQSYGYEDFVEGLRPELIGEKISYSVRRGIFRKACDSARISGLVRPGLSGKPLHERTIYKMSLGPAKSSIGKQTLQACLENGSVVLGWGDDIDFTECQNQNDIRNKIKEEQANIEKLESHVRYVNVFKNELKIGDIVIVSQGNDAFRAIGEVVGEYECLEESIAGDFHQMRSVRWLAVLENNRNVDEIYTKKFMMSALYKLNSNELKFDVLASLIQGEVVHSKKNHVLIIDEINRANISKVFGELITLLESDKREGAANPITVKLAYSGDEFCVPANLHIIGTMNTADRSIALLDTALRRRFDFEELQPDHTALPEAPVADVNLRSMLIAINERIEYLYDRDHTIGHAYFINVKTLADLDQVFRRKVIPLLQEYFYENWSKVQSVLSDNAGSFITSTTSVPAGLESLAGDSEARPRYRLNDAPFSVAAFLNIYQ
jgi:5-methylcytosine-specific restriction protein B